MSASGIGYRIETPALAKRVREQRTDCHREEGRREVPGEVILSAYVVDCKSHLPRRLAENG
jgi:hypothetical protein